ncbi:MAG: hypothetical protein B7Y05_15605 [Polynucleobacter sp. 24-46-87]|jgi:hypothetical protein|uniref:hypothetical protein n=1 Tax=Polynucleobacter sp. 35-46-11 TaxID=1970425 RepID=UPI000BC60C0D|nr:hypothetical protein [Polynucleobacter sp. 35-46-11]OYY10343.1 MAG: hypothetical protein B7Y67_15125 [Polynucleobacter sp. 35-46-11]OZA11098.1 MAG: hypothetical protein B7Y05_15605 [Polynucleobacter sp. 24-46-87]
MNIRKDIPNRTSKEWSTMGVKKYALLLLEFLRISPSYALAHLIRSESIDAAKQKKLALDLYSDDETALTKVQQLEILNGFDKVLKTYDEFGDVTTIDIEDWWTNRGIHIFGSPFEKPVPVKIAGISKHESYEPLFEKSLRNYFEVKLANQGQPPAIIVGIPLGLPKRVLMQRISKLIDAEKIPVQNKAKRSTKPLAVQRLRSEPLFIMLRLLMAKAQHEDWPLWRLGLQAKVSAKFSKLDIQVDKKRGKDSDAKVNLNILTSRYLLKAKLVAENTARGEFPSSQKVFLPKYDFEDIYQRLTLKYKKINPRSK